MSLVVEQTATSDPLGPIIAHNTVLAYQNDVVNEPHPLSSPWCIGDPYRHAIAECVNGLQEPNNRPLGCAPSGT
jgi:hypothetical protein